MRLPIEEEERGGMVFYEEEAEIIVKLIAELHSPSSYGLNASTYLSAGLAEPGSDVLDVAWQSSGCHPGYTWMRLGTHTHTITY